MSSFNKVILIGNLTRDPETKQLASGQSVCRFSVATNRQIKNRNGDAPMQEVCFIDVSVWGNQAENCEKFLEKGKSVMVEGRLKLDSWQDQEGQKRSKHTIVAERVVFLGSPQAEAGDDVATEPEYSAPRTNRNFDDKPRSFNSRPAFKPSDRGSKSFSSKGEVNLKDQDEFSDELPF